MPSEFMVDAYLDELGVKRQRVGQLEARVAELEAALHDIAGRTWDIQYEAGVTPQTVRFASGLHNIARAAVEPPAPKGNDHD